MPRRRSTAPSHRHTISKRPGAVQPVHRFFRRHRSAAPDEEADMGRSVVGGAAILSTLAAIFVAALIFLPSPSALADVTGEMAGSWKIDTPSGHTPPACLNIAEDDVVTISEVGSNELTLTFPSGESFQLTPTAPKSSGALASWIGSGDVTDLDFYGISKLAPGRGDAMGFTLQRSSTCRGSLYALRLDGPVALVKDPE